MKFSKIIWCVVFFIGYAKAQVTVGWDVGCDYDMSQDPSALQQAIDSGATEVRLSNQNPYTASINIEDQIVLKGGYSTCSEAEIDNQIHANAVINAAGFGLYALKIKGVENANVLIDSINLINGEDSALKLIANDGMITINNVKITDSTGESAGGVYIKNYQTTQNPKSLNVVMKGVVIKNNEAIYFGGGLNCQSVSGNVPINLHLSGGTLFHTNHANNRGGGLYLYGCDMQYEAAHNLSINNGHREIYDNTSVDSGGGLSIQDADVSLLGDEFKAFTISSNEAGDLQNSNISGGGLFVVGESEVTLINAHVNGNVAQQYGAGLYTSTGSKVFMDVADAGCHYDEYCSKLQSNQLEGNNAYGAAAAATGGEMTVKRTLIEFNKSSQFGYVAHARNDAQLTFEGNLIIDNGSTDGSVANYGFDVQNSGSLHFYYNTSFSNLLTGNFIDMSDSSSLFMIGNIVDEYADILYTSVDASAEINCNMLRQDNNIIVPMTDTVIGTVDFIDPSTFGNFRLGESSVNAMDVCSDVPYEPGKDLSNNSRGIDNPDVMNINGLFDLGAYEFNENWDVIFANSFD